MQAFDCLGAVGDMTRKCDRRKAHQDAAAVSRQANPKGLGLYGLILLAAFAVLSFFRVCSFGVRA